MPRPRGSPRNGPFERFRRLGMRGWVSVPALRRFLETTAAADMLKRTERPQSLATPTGDARLRVVTAGRVGNMEARLGTSGFDVVAVAHTEADLIVALADDEPD